MSKLDDTIKKVKQIIDSDEPFVFPDIEPEKPLMSDEDAQFVVEMVARKLAQPHKSER